MRVRRTRALRASREAVWAVLADPWHQPRWWPRTARVEGVSRDGWTSVLVAEKSGRSVRADWRVEVNREPVERVWAQELDGTPFARVFSRNAVGARLERLDDGTEVTLEVDQALRGWGRFAPFVVKRAMRRLLEQALEGLAEAVEP
jgi:uncharacterized protein YndB with AHSA1/START domain